MVNKRETVVATHRGATMIAPEKQIDWKRIFQGAAGFVPNFRLVMIAVLIALGITLYQKREQVFVYLDHPIETIELIGAFEYQDDRQIQALLSNYVGESFLFTDLESVKSLVDADPWIKNSTVSRLWPGRLVVTVSEQQPVAYWNDMELLNTEGQIFKPQDRNVVQELPILNGPSDTTQQSALAMLSMFNSMDQQMADFDLELMDLTQDGRGGWTLGLTNGLAIKLGRGELTEKLARFGRVYETQLQENLAAVESIDARYPNGVAVQWKPHTASMDVAAN